MSLPIGLAVFAKDIRNLQRRPIGALLLNSAAVTSHDGLPEHLPLLGPEAIQGTLHSPHMRPAHMRVPFGGANRIVT